MTLTRRSPPLRPDARRPDARRHDALRQDVLRQDAIRVRGPSALPRGSLQRLRLVARILGVTLWTLPASLVQTILIALPGDAKRRFARLYWATVCRILGIERRVIGHLATGRSVLFVCNHTSWLDIPALGGTLPACFVAKTEVAQWPVVRTIAWLGRTVFVSRRASDTTSERDAMRARLDAGDDLILFPEGTSSDGARVLPFRSPFFSIAEPRDGARPPLIQPVSIVFDRLDFLPTGRATRPTSSWYGDMDLGSHFWRLTRHAHLRATILLHPPLDPIDYASRKALARAVWQIVAAGAAALRQNRPVAPPTLAAVNATTDSLDTAAPIIGTVEVG